MKKLLIIFLCSPIFGLASFPIKTDNIEGAIIAVSLDCDLNKKIDHRQYITNITIENDDPWIYVRWTFVIIASLFIFLFFLGVLALGLYNPSGKSILD